MASSDRPGGADDTPGSGDAIWRERAIERSTRVARQRAAKRVQQFLNAAREIIAEKSSTEFTVQEVVERSRQSLRSFYQYFDGKHELLLALFEEEMDIVLDRVMAASGDGDPLRRLERAVVTLYELCVPGRASERTLFFEFGQRLLVSHPEEVNRAYVPLFGYLEDLTEQAATAGLLRPGTPRRQAAMVLQATTTTAGRAAGARQPITADELWRFCLRAIAPDDVVSARGGEPLVASAD